MVLHLHFLLQLSTLKTWLTSKYCKLEGFRTWKFAHDLKKFFAQLIILWTWKRVLEIGAGFCHCIFVPSHIKVVIELMKCSSNVLLFVNFSYIFYPTLKLALSWVEYAEVRRIRMPIESSNGHPTWRFCCLPGVSRVPGVSYADTMTSRSVCTSYCSSTLCLSGQPRTANLHLSQSR